MSVVVIQVGLGIISRAYEWPVGLKISGKALFIDRRMDQKLSKCFNSTTEERSPQVIPRHVIKSETQPARRQRLRVCVHIGLTPDPASYSITGAERARNQANELDRRIRETVVARQTTK